VENAEVENAEVENAGAYSRVENVRVG